MSESVETVNEFADVVSQMKDEAMRLKELSQNIKAGANTGEQDPTAVLKNLESLVSQFSGDNKLLHLTEKLKSLTSRYKELSPEEKVEFDSKAREQLSGKLDEIREIAGKLSKEASSKAMEQFTYSYTTIIICFIVVLSIFAFFGYKLYKSLKDKEIKREEKRKSKQMRKKK